ncbi:MAG TPA: 4Fe-4S dicluster domain-containing protein [Candidatus Anaerotruncus excrementipullorum]|uniref:4Fe-4S dicluster domain-containing protein n=1 Tax=Candidatus Anaerotruncus excrementipullorum TaxID=2838465 RepID=A0A9D2B6N0_9FIRM|nr:4Fe-4S dicluster domain-containing protein [Candidatus Anaerotruncus excrementipullorum]
MDIQRVFAVYFSPTGGSRRYVREIARRLDPQFQEIDLTTPAGRAQPHRFTPRDLVILGSPVYAGRLPRVAGGLFASLEGDHTPAVFTVSYGNRAFDDALVEEQDLCQARGFVGVAAAAWIAPHTFSSRIAAGRPDQADLAQVDAFVDRLRQALAGPLPQGLALPGNRPYKQVSPMSFHPQGGEGCTRCGRCVQNCPAGAIPAEDPRVTDPQACIVCLACMKNCPAHARTVPGPGLEAVCQKLEGLLLARRQEPQWYF